MSESQEPVVRHVSAPGGKVVVAESIGMIVISPSVQEYLRVFVGVPAPGQLLVGRDQRVAELRAELLTGGVVAVAGLPGVGKTALALAMARDDAVLDHFTGGVLWARLGPSASVGSVLARWGTMLGLDVSAEEAVAERAQRLHDHLQMVASGKRVLVVLDDAWRWEDVAPFRVFAEPGNAMLVTTRDTELGRRFSGQRPTRVAELDENASVALLARLCPEAMIDPQGLRELARAVGGLPLALVLVGGELAANAGLERWVRDAIERLKAAQEQLGLVDDQHRPGMEGVPPTLRAVLETSLRTLPDERTKVAFVRLGVFAAKPADLSREAALAVWGGSDQEADRWLRVLAQRNLLEITSGGRFSLHQLLAQVARMHLGEQVTEVSQSHFNYYLTLVNRDREDWRAIEAELPQVLQAWDWASTTRGHDAHVLELVPAMQAFMDRRGLWATLLWWYERALHAARELGHAKAESAMLSNIGMVYERRGELEQALEYHEQALHIERRVADRKGEASTLTFIGEVHYGRGELGQAAVYYEQALAICRDVGDRWGEATALNNIGLVHQSRGDLDRALEHCEQALAIRREVGDRRGEATTLNNIGEVHDSRGELDQALEYLDQALRILRAEGERRIEASTLSNIGMLHRRRGELDQALEYLEQALPIERAVGDRRGEATTLNNIGLVHQSRGDLDHALEYYEQALLIERAVGYLAGEAVTQFNIGMVHRRGGGSPSAVAALERAVHLYELIGHPDLESNRRVLEQVRAESAAKNQ